MKNKNKRIVVHAELRKESQTFDGYLKYEITIKNEKGKLEKIPAYGKDLQDALSRVVHDSMVDNIEKKVINKVPAGGWAVAWVLGFALIVSSISLGVDKNPGNYIIIALVAYAMFTVSIANWLTLRNRIK